MRPPPTVEEWDAKLLFESLDLLRNRRLRQKQLLCSSAKAQVMGYGAKNDQAEVFNRQWAYHSLKNKYHFPRCDASLSRLMRLATSPMCAGGKLVRHALRLDLGGSTVDIQLNAIHEAGIAGGQE